MMRTDDNPKTNNKSLIKMKKHIYISPSALVYEITGKPVLSTTSIVIVRDEKITEEEDIGFVKEEDSPMITVNLWDDEW